MVRVGVMMVAASMAACAVDDPRGADVLPEDSGIRFDAAQSSMDAAFEQDADVTLTPDAADAVVRDAAPDMRVPVDDSCFALLDTLDAITWASTGPMMGVTEPVRVQPQIGGISYRYTESTTATPMNMACLLAPQLVKLSEVLARFDIVEVEHIGIYNYRCIGGGDPSTGCTPSEHARATAIDLHAFHLRNGDVWSTEDDWVIRSTADTCTGPYANDADEGLHQIACALYEERVFNIILTPDYNSAHRNHFHVDLTEDSHYLRSWTPMGDSEYDDLYDE